MSHVDAPLTPTVASWVARYLESGKVGLADRTSSPQHSSTPHPGHGRGTRRTAPPQAQVINVVLRGREVAAVVQTWFQGMNPLLGDRVPARALRRA